MLVFGYERIVLKTYVNQTDNYFAWLRLRRALCPVVRSLRKERKA